MQRQTRLGWLAAWLCLGGAALAAPEAWRVVCDGALANSGESGAAVVRFAPNPSDRPRNGMGVVLDDAGALWSRGGPGDLLRYSLDGRLLGRWAIPRDVGQSDRLARVGDHLAMLLGERVWFLPLPPPADAKPTACAIRGVVAISYNSWKGSLAVMDGDNKVHFVDPATAEPVAAVGPLPITGRYGFDLAADGAIWIISGRDLHAFSPLDGSYLPGHPRTVVGERESPPTCLQRLGDQWWGHNWHGTVKRYNATLEPDPGVVLGGSSGWVIGSLPGDYDLDSGQGMARVGPDLYALSGITGAVLLGQWLPGERRLRIVRRIGCLPTQTAIALDAEGRVLAHRGRWQWSDGPAVPQDDGLTLGLPFPMATLANGCVAGPVRRYGDIWWGYNPIVSFRAEGPPEGVTLMPDAIAAAATLEDKREVVLLLNARGELQVARVGTDGRLQSVRRADLIAEPAPAAWTGLAGLPEGRVAAAADGIIVLFAPRDGSWYEQRRWPAAPADAGLGLDAAAKLGPSIALAGDGDRLWLADRDHHHVQVLDAATLATVATFGVRGQPGDDLGHLDRPGWLAARAGRAVVYDAGNQRLLKLRLVTAELATRTRTTRGN